MNSWFIPSQELFDEVQKMFKMPLKERLAIWAETEKYRWKEDESVWRQKREIDPNSYEVTFDGEFVCFFNTTQSKQEALLAVLEGIKKLYKEGKIFFNKEMYAVRDAEIEAKKTIEIEKPGTPEDKMLAEVLSRHAKRNGKRVKTKERKPDVF